MTGPADTTDDDRDVAVDDWPEDDPAKLGDAAGAQHEAGMQPAGLGRGRLVWFAIGGAFSTFAAVVAALFVVTAPPAPKPGTALDMPAPAETSLASLDAARSETTVRNGEASVVVTAGPAAAAAFARLGPIARDRPLVPAPVEGLIDEDRAGRLPKVAENGRVPRRVYARPFEQKDERARLTLIVAGIGLSRAASEAAIERLPGPVVMAIDAYAPHADEWAQRARSAGHELLAMLPLQPADAATVDAGPRALLATGKREDQLRRLEAVMSSFTGYVGLLATGATRYADAPQALEPLLDDIARRGLLVVDGTGGSRPVLYVLAERRPLPRVRIDSVVDAHPSPAAIDAELAKLVTIAGERLTATGLLRPTPLTLERVRAWLANIDTTRYVLAPVSAVATIGGS